MRYTINRVNMKDIWKRFEETELTHSSAHHLMAIHYLLKKNGYARSIDVSKHLNLTRGSVSITLNKLKQREYVVEDENKFFRLTDKGRQLVNSIMSVRHMLIKLFHDVLDLPEEIAETDACKIEHLIGHETGERLITFVGFILSSTPSAQTFRKEFRDFGFLCNSQPECDVCELDCFFSEKETIA